MKKMLHNENETAEEKLCPICRQRHTDGKVDESVWEENYPDDETAFELLAKEDGQEKESICILCEIATSEFYLQIEEDLKMRKLEDNYFIVLNGRIHHYQYEMQDESKIQKKGSYLRPQIKAKVFKKMLNQTIESLQSIKDELNMFISKQNSIKASIKSKMKNHTAGKRKGKKK